MNSEIVLKQATEIAVTFGPKIIAAILILIVGSWIVKGLVKGVSKVMEKGGTDASL